MTIQLSAGVRNAQANAIESTVGTAPKLQLRTGAPPANCAAAATGSLIAEMTLPSDWLTAGSAGLVEKVGTWQDLSADLAGIVGHFRIVDTAGTTCHMQGTVTETGGGGDMTLDNTDVEDGQSVTITSFSYQRGNA